MRLRFVVGVLGPEARIWRSVWFVQRTAIGGLEHKRLDGIQPGIECISVAILGDTLYVVTVLAEDLSFACKYAFGGQSLRDERVEYQMFTWTKRHKHDREDKALSASIAPSPEHLPLSSALNNPASSLYALLRAFQSLSIRRTSNGRSSTAGSPPPMSPPISPPPASAPPELRPLSIAKSSASS